MRILYLGTFWSSIRAGSGKTCIEVTLGLETDFGKHSGIPTKTTKSIEDFSHSFLIHLVALGFFLSSYFFIFIFYFLFFIFIVHIFASL